MGHLPNVISSFSYPFLTFFREYYFSVENLCKDMYFRSLMHQQTGFVEFTRIFEFHRMRNLLISAQMHMFPNATTDAVPAKQESTNQESEDATPSSVPASASAPEPASEVVQETPVIPELDVEWAISFVVQALATSEYLETQGNTVRLRHGFESWILATTSPTTSTASKSTKTLNDASDPLSLSNQETVVSSTSKKSGITMALKSAAAAKSNDDTLTSLDAPPSLAQEPTSQSESGEWTSVSRAKQIAVKNAAHQVASGAGAGSDLFQFDESEGWAAADHHQYQDSHFVLDSEFEDEDLESISIVTQRLAGANVTAAGSSPNSSSLGLPPRRQPASKPTFKVNNADVADVINEGLCLYEKNIFSKHGKNGSSNSLQSTLLDKPQPPVLEKSGPMTMSSHAKRFFRGGLSSASPPVGWLVNQNPAYVNKHFEVPSAPPSSKVNSSSFGGHSLKSVGSGGGKSLNGGHQNSFGGRSFTGPSSLGSSFKEFQPFQHPSYELLKENGFVQQKYTKYHAKAIKGIHDTLFFNAT